LILYQINPFITKVGNFSIHDEVFRTDIFTNVCTTIIGFSTPCKIHVWKNERYYKSEIIYAILNDKYESGNIWVTSTANIKHKDKK
jgi:hypothetical protein